MTITFIPNTRPFLDSEIWHYLLNKSDCFNLDNLEEIDRNVERSSFFNVLEDDKRVGFVFFDLGGEQNIEISLGKIQDDCRGFLKKVLLELDNIKPLLPPEWFDVNNINHCRYWSGIIKGTNPKLEYVKRVNLECGFEEYNENTLDIPICYKRFYFRKNIA